MRYEIQIIFKDQYGDKSTASISQCLKTMREANKYKKMIDDSVHSAWLIDLVTGHKTIWK